MEKIEGKIIGILFVIWAFISLLMLRDGSIGAVLLLFGCIWLYQAFKEEK